MIQFKTIDGLLLRDMVVAGAALLEKNREAVDALNVFPVPDGDTGTNMSLTMQSATREVSSKEFLRADEAANALAKGALRGARGNSGVITSPRNPEGGFWHKKRYPNQMWLDGLYMGGPICAQYGKEFGRPLCFEVCAYQALLMEKRTKDPATGLLYHAYDQSRAMAWADPVTGQSPEFWGRSMGWVPVALLDDLDFFPEEFAPRGEIIRMTTDLLKALVPYQDEKTGLWYQVVNKGDDPRNWLETSCSCLYVAAICKAVRRGFLDRSYLRFARKGYEGIISRLKWDEKGIIIDGVCIGTGVGDYEHYLARPTSANDLHGMGAFILMCQEAEQIL